MDDSKLQTSICVDDYEGYRSSLDADEDYPQFIDIRNFERVDRCPDFCVMCGHHQSAIPVQNKNVCRNCDSSYWYVQRLGILVKFCKGNLIFDFTYVYTSIFKIFFVLLFYTLNEKP